MRPDTASMEDREEPADLGAEGRSSPPGETDRAPEQDSSGGGATGTGEDGGTADPQGGDPDGDSAPGPSDADRVAEGAPAAREEKGVGSPASSPYLFDVSAFAAAIFGPAPGDNNGSDGGGGGPSTNRTNAGGPLVDLRRQNRLVPGYWVPAAGTDVGGSGAQLDTYVSPGRSALFHWRLVALLTALGLVVGVLYGFVRSPTYTSMTDLYVGKTLNVDNTAAIAGLATAATQIAQDYAQLETTAAVTKRVKDEIHAQRIPGTLSASVVSNTPEIAVTATARSAAAAVRLATAGGKALEADVAKLNRYSTARLNSLKQQYAATELRISNDQAQIGTLRSHGVPNTDKRIERLQQDISVQNLQAQTLSSQYANQQSPYPAEESVLQSLGPAKAATSDRKKAIEIGSVSGLLIGLLLGVAVSSAIDLRRRASTSAAQA